MAQWINPIYDRTQADVDYAKSQLNQGNNDVEFKGCINVTDIRRIENNTRYLADELIKLYYFNTLTTYSWDLSSIPYLAHINRIINNVGILWGKYHKPNGSVELPPTLLHYEHANAIEKNLYLIKEMLDNMISSFRECGTFQCGED